MAQVQVGPDPQLMTCPSCHAQILTVVRYQATTRTHILALALCILLCWPCCCLPYCIGSCNNENHYCPNCNAYIGTYQS